MRQSLTVILVLAFGVIVFCTPINGQSSEKRRTPALTNDDLGVRGRDVVSAPAESEAQPPAKAKPEPARGSIAWHRDIRSAVDLARSEDKLVVVDVYTDWCGWCKKMDKTIYSDPKIVALSREQVFLKVNAEDRSEGQYFAQQMGVRGYPTTIILDGQGRVLDVARGYISTPQAFSAFVERARGSGQR